MLNGMNITNMRLALTEITFHVDVKYGTITVYAIRNCRVCYEGKKQDVMKEC